MIELLDDAAAFAALAGPLIDGDVANTVLATVLDGILAGEYADPPPQFAVVRADDGAVVGAALRTPPHGLLATALSPGDAAALVGAWSAAGRALPAVMAPSATARALTDAIAAAEIGRPALHTAEGLHVVLPDEVRDPPRPAPGRLRAARVEEADAVAKWEIAFAREAGLVVQDDDWVRARGRVRLEGGRTHIWDHDGPKALVGHTATVAGTGRIGPVYTPPEHRSRGYASSAVAALTRSRFAAGARRMTLFTDRSNPTSNRIYADVGYRRVADFEHYDVV